MRRWRAEDFPADTIEQWRSLLPSWAATADARVREDLDERLLLPGEAAYIAAAAAHRRVEYIAGRDCAHRALRNLGLDDQPILADEQRVPRWPAGVSGSITHSNGYCAAAVARASDARSIGLDVELRSRLQPRLWRLVCTPAERAWLAEQDEARRVDLAALIFSAKEAAYKAQFPLTRRWLGFQEVQVQVQDDRFEASLTKLPVDPSGVFPMIGRFAYSGPLVLSAVVLPPG